MLSICLFWDIINVTYLGHYHNYFIQKKEIIVFPLDFKKKRGIILKNGGNTSKTNVLKGRSNEDNRH